MKPKTDVAGAIFRLKESLGSSKTRRALFACGAFSMLVIAVSTFRPLIANLHRTSNTLHEVQTELLNQHISIAALQDSDVQGRMVPREEVPLVIDELTGRGQALGLHFSSISLGDLTATEHTGVGRLPLILSIESEYENAGQFLAYVEACSDFITEMESLTVSGMQQSLPKVSMELTINLYVENKYEDKQ